MFLYNNVTLLSHIVEIFFF